MRILHATDFSEGADRARAAATALARALPAELVLIHVVGPLLSLSDEVVGPDALERIRVARTARAEAELERRVLETHRTGLAVRGIVRVGEPSLEILRAADEEAVDFLVLGTAGLGGVGRLLVGSVAERVVRRARCPVMTVRQEASALGAAS